MSEKNKGRICLECKHCSVYSGRQGWSEYTPSAPFEYECLRKHDLGIDIYGKRGDKASMLKGIRQAETCEDFVLEVQF